MHGVTWVHVSLCSLIAMRLKKAKGGAGGGWLIKMVHAGVKCAQIVGVECLWIVFDGEDV